MRGCMQHSSALAGNRSSSIAPLQRAIYRARYSPHTTARDAIYRNKNQICQCSSSSEQGDRPDKPFVVTTPLFYANASPHIGSAYPTMLADAIARFKRLQGQEVVFITGTDEHGEKIVKSAEKVGRTPKEHTDLIVEEFKALWESLDIKYDQFIRTTQPKHAKLVKEMMGRVIQKDDIFQGKYEGYYCVDCEEYKADKDMDDDKQCLIHKTKCEYRNEENYFFRLSKYTELVQQLLDDKQFLTPKTQRTLLRQMCSEGVPDFSISRTNIQWGLDLPLDEQHTIYVWFDALNGYISALLPESGGTLADACNNGWPADLHIIGKDIIRFHCTYWPGMLQSADLPLPKKVLAHGFLLKDGFKMGKSVGNVIDPVALTAAYGSDAVRFYFLAYVPVGKDGNFVEETFKNKINATLANTLGNCLQRSSTLIKKFHKRVLPMGALDVDKNNELRTIARMILPSTIKQYNLYQIDKAVEEIMILLDQCDSYLDSVQPWNILKDTEDTEAQALGTTCLIATLESLRICSVLLSPITPQLSLGVYLRLGYTEADYQGLTLEDAEWGGGSKGRGLVAGQTLPKPKPVFKRIECDPVTEIAPQAVVAAEGGAEELEAVT